MNKMAFKDRAVYFCGAGAITDFGDPLRANVRRWDELAGQLASTFPLELLPLTKFLRPGNRILDYGCGDGRILESLRSLGARDVVGCDAAARMCQLARSRNPGLVVHWLNNPRGQKFPPASFDGVLLIGILSSVVPLAERRALVKRMRLLLRPAGRLVLGDFGCSDEPPYPERYRGTILEPRTFQTEDHLLIHHFTPTELEELLEEAFRIDDLRTMPVPTVHRRIVPGHVILATAH